MPAHDPTANDRAWLLLLASVFALIAVVVYLSFHMLHEHADEADTVTAAVAFERAAFLNAHDCDEHLRLPHTPSPHDDAAWLQVEAERNAQHRDLCRTLKQRARDAARFMKTPLYPINRADGSVALYR